MKKTLLRSKGIKNPTAVSVSQDSWFAQDIPAEPLSFNDERTQIFRLRAKGMVGGLLAFAAALTVLITYLVAGWPS